MKRLVFVCQVYHPDPISTSRLFTLLLEAIKQKKPDLEIRVYCGFPSQGNTRLPRYEQKAGIHIHRIGPRLNLKRNMLFRLISYLGYSTGLLFHLWRSGPETTVLSTSNPPFNPWLCSSMKALRGFRYYHFSLDLFPEGLEALGNLKKRGLLAGLWRGLNRPAYRNADGMPVLGRDMATLLRETYNLSAEKTTYIPHWSPVDPNQQPPSFESSLYTKKLGLQNKFVVQYSGNMGVWHDMNILVRAAAALKKEKHIQFLFIGNGIRAGEAKQLALELGADNILWHDFVPIEDLAQSLACAHLSIVSLREGLTGIAVPCKYYGILLSGRAVLAQVPGDSEIALSIRESGCGYHITPGDLEELIETIRKAAADPSGVAKKGRKAYELGAGPYSLETAVQRFSNHLKLND